jgi:hypothetical protein
MTKQKSLFRIKPQTTLFLKLGFAAICLQLSLLYIAADEMYRAFRTYAYIHYAPALVYVAMSISLLFGGAFLLERVIKETGGDD